MKLLRVPRRSDNRRAVNDAVNGRCEGDAEFRAPRQAGSGLCLKEGTATLARRATRVAGKLRGPSPLWCRLQDEAFLEWQQSHAPAGEAAHSENADGLTHKSSTHIAVAKAPPRRKIREKLGACEFTLCTTCSNVPHKCAERFPGID